MKQLEQQYIQTKDRQVKTMSRIMGGDFAAGEDVVQEAYTRAIQYFPTYDPSRGPMLPWFNRIMFNALRDVQREYKNRPTETCEELTVDDIITSSDSSETILDRIDQVKNDKHQQVLYLFYVLGYNSREISQIEEEVTQTNVNVIVKRFKDSLL